MKKLQVGMIGGGGDQSFFGAVHRRAIALDDTRSVTAGALRHRPEDALAAAEEWGIKGYGDYTMLLDAVVNGDEPLDYVTITTPNFVHYEQAKAFLENKIPVVCEKPMTMTVEEAEHLGRVAAKNDVPFILAHTYTGHPMMMHARVLVQGGEIGDVRKVESTKL